MRLLTLLEKYTGPNSQLQKYLTDRPVDHYHMWHMFPEWYDDHAHINDLMKSMKVFSHNQFMENHGLFDRLPEEIQTAYITDLKKTRENFDVRYYWGGFPDWYNHHYHRFDFLLTRMGVDRDEFIDNPEYFDQLPPLTQSSFIGYLRQQGIDTTMQDDPAEAPSWAYLSPNRSNLLPRTTWLTHFTDDVKGIAFDGFTKGIDRMDRLGLTTYFSDAAKVHGGYNFAFHANSRDASGAAQSDKYGEHFVMFQNSGVEASHHSDEETQVIFIGKDVDPRGIIMITRQYGTYTVWPHPTKDHYGQETKGGGLYQADTYDEVVAWVTKNADSYRKVLTGW